MIHILKQVHLNPKKYVLIFLSILFITETGFIINAQWAGDFWEHCAVLKELIRDPVNPSHPIIHADLPHAFFSPYLIFLGFTGKLMGASPIAILSVAAVFNLLLWFFGLFLFIKIFFWHNAWVVFFYMIILPLFLWGLSPWIYSSFFHFNTLHLVLPYPSTFAVSLAFMAAYIFAMTLRKKKHTIPFLTVAILLQATILLTHPTTFLFSLCVCFVIAFTEFRDQKKPVIILIVFLCAVLPFIMARYWPYYPFWDLLFNMPNGHQFHLDSQVLYENVLLKTAPILIALLIITRQDLARIQTPLFILLALLAIYLFGLASERYGYGRVISFIALMAHLLIAGKLADGIPITRKTAVVSALSIVLTFPYLYDVLKTVRHNPPFIGTNSYEAYQFLEKHLAPEDVVLTGMESIKLVPAFGGRVTASDFPPYWIGDNEERLQDVHTFFKKEDVSATQRKAILAKYDVDYILLNQYDFSLLDRLMNGLDLSSESIYYKSGRFILIKT